MVPNRWGNSGLKCLIEKATQTTQKSRHSTSVQTPQGSPCSCIRRQQPRHDVCRKFSIQVRSADVYKVDKKRELLSRDLQFFEFLPLRKDPVPVSHRIKVRHAAPVPWTSLTGRGTPLPCLARLVPSSPAVKNVSVKVNSNLSSSFLEIALSRKDGSLAHSFMKSHQ